MLESPLNDDDLVIGLVGVLLAGHETTASLIGNAVYILLNQREECWQKVCEHTDLIPGAIEEVLRYDGSVMAFYRTAQQETKLGGATIPEGALLFVLYGSANHDEAHFPHAEQFDLLRSSNKHLAFGYGTHMCAGAPLARLEGCVAVEVLSRRLPHLYLDADQPLAHIPRLQFRGFEHLRVKWDS